MEFNIKDLSEETLREVKDFADYKHLSVEEATKILLAEGIKRLIPVNCNICKELLERKLLKICNGCGNPVHCGYTYSRSHSKWKGETWNNEPITFCFLCHFNLALEEEEIITNINEYQESLLNYIEENTPEIGVESGDIT